MYAFSIMVFLALFSSVAQAQFTSASLFPEMKAINPAVINGRSIGMFSLGAASEKYEKTQDLSSNFGAGATGTADTELSELKFFYGGKAGGFLTTEITVNNATGDKTDTVSREGSSESTVTSITNQYINVGMGLGKFFGLSISRLVFDVTQSYDFSFGGTDASGSFDYEITGLIFRGGVVIPLGVNIGLYYESATATTAATGQPETEAEYPKAGVAVGFSGKSLRFEVGYEKDMEEFQEFGQTYSPNKLYGSFEMRLSGMTIGYTGSMYRDGFIDLEDLMRQNMVYAGVRDEDRLVNAINFALGNTSGHAFSASAFFSTVENQESGQLFSDGNKYPTETKSLGVSAKYGYAF